MTPQPDEFERAVRALMAHLPHPHWDRDSAAYRAYRAVKAMLNERKRSRAKAKEGA